MNLSPSAHTDTFTRDNLPAVSLWPTIEFSIPEVQYPEFLNAATVLIDNAVEKFGADAPCLLTPDGVSWTYGTLLTKSNQIAQVLSEDLGLVAGNRVLLRGPNNPWLVACWLGVLKAGGVVVTTMHALRAAEIADVISLTQPSIAISDHRFVDELLKASVGNIAIVSYGSDDPTDLITLSEAKSGVFENVATAADDVALLGPTSGTTGTPKITMHFHRDILANADTFALFILKPVPEDVFAGSPPLAFTFGLGGLVVFPLRFGASVLLTERTTPSELAELCSTHRVTVLFTAPTAYRAIMREGKGDHLKGIRRAVSAGEHLPASVWQEVFEQTGLKLINGIGSTEMLHVFISAADDDIRPGATGLAIPGFRATVLNEEGNEVAPNQLGRLAVIGPTGCKYLNDDRQMNYVTEGWNITGDTFRQDEDGYFGTKHVPTA